MEPKMKRKFVTTLKVKNVQKIGNKKNGDCDNALLIYGTQKSSPVCIKAFS